MMLHATRLVPGSLIKTHSLTVRLAEQPTSTSAHLTMPQDTRSDLLPQIVTMFFADSILMLPDCSITDGHSWVVWLTGGLRKATSKAHSTTPSLSCSVQKRNSTRTTLSLSTSGEHRQSEVNKVLQPKRPMLSPAVITTTLIGDTKTARNVTQELLLSSHRHSSQHGTGR